MLLALALLAASPDWLFGAGGAWSIPTSPSSGNFRGGKERQDFAVSLLVERQWSRFFVDGQLVAGGFSASGPSFVGEASVALAQTPLEPVLVAPFAQLIPPSFRMGDPYNPGNRPATVPLLLTRHRLLI